MILVGAPLADLKLFTHGGFVGLDGLPTRENPSDWYVWHFTRPEYIPEIVAAGGLVCDDDVSERSGSVADQGIKAERKLRIVVAEGYPEDRTVSSHVPWYIAARSPMLFRVMKENSQELLDRLVFFGARLGDIAEADLEWVVSNANASSKLTRFTTDIGRIGSFVDFDLLKSEQWFNTPDDPARKARRAAEVLVHQFVPLGVMSQVACSNDETLAEVRTHLEAAGYTHFEYRNAKKISWEKR